VISTLAIKALSLQSPLGDAAKAAGVKLFILSEFGGDTQGKTDGVFAVKNAQREHLERIGLPWAAFFTGPFADRIFYLSALGLDVRTGKVEVGGSGDSLISFTSRSDIARYVVHVLLNLPPGKLHNRVFKIESERTTINRVLAEYQQHTGKKLEITHIPLEQVEHAAKAGDFKAFFQLGWEKEGTYGSEEEMNVDWPEFHPQTVLEAMLSYKE